MFLITKFSILFCWENKNCPFHITCYHHWHITSRTGNEHTKKRTAGKSKLSPEIDWCWLISGFFLYSLAERSVSTCSYQLRDPPPPYPGKNPEAVSDYLPSYESAVAMERRRQEAREGESMTECASRVSVDFSISSDHFNVFRNDSSEQMSRESTSADRNRPVTVVSEWTISPHSSRTENTECVHVQNEELTSACMSQTNGTEISGL